MTIANIKSASPPGFLLNIYVSMKQKRVKKFKAIVLDYSLVS